MFFVYQASSVARARLFSSANGYVVNKKYYSTNQRCVHTLVVNLRIQRKDRYWQKRIEYKILSLTYKVLITAQSGYLRNLISVDSPYIETRSLSSVILSRPSSSSLKITNRSFRYASPCLWNKLPASFRQPNPAHSFSHISQPNSLGLSVSSSTLSLCITPTLFHSKLKRYISLNPSHHTGWRKKTGPSDLIVNILKTKLRFAWELVNFYNIIFCTVINFLFKNFIVLWRHLAKTQLLCDAEIYLYSVNKRQ